MFTTWCLICGALLIAVGLSDTWRQRLPVSTAAIYLCAGYLLGPSVFGLLRVGLQEDAALLARISEVALLISLFAVGLRLRVPLGDALWRVPWMLATFTMLITIGLLTGFGLLLGLAPGAALLLAAVLAPTDPVLASDVQVEHIRDRDQLRFSLTAEGGLNDGAAYPFVMLALGILGLGEVGAFTWRGWTMELLWGGLSGLALGWGLGVVFSRAVVFLRKEKEQALGMESFFTLGLIALSYGLASLVHAYGFLAVFASGLAMRHVERRETPREAAEDTAGDSTGSPAAASADATKASAHMAKAVLDFTLDLERIAELVVMLLIGSLMTREAFTWATVAVALFLLFVARPIAVYLTTVRLALTQGQRRLAAWLGIRGIGSMYYLSFASSHGARGGDADFVASAVLVTIALSVLLHGSSATPMMRLYKRARGGRRRPRE
jgi:NhaP-type Na+/H+ or K+/H+ antiporter